jgi:hypothetical protein
MIRLSSVLGKSTARTGHRSSFVGVYRLGRPGLLFNGHVGTKLTGDRRLIPIPASKTEERIKLNADIFDFELTPTDMEELSSLEVGDAAAASVAALKEVRGP